MAIILYDSGDGLAQQDPDSDILDPSMVFRSRRDQVLGDRDLSVNGHRAVTTHWLDSVHIL